MNAPGSERRNTTFEAPAPDLLHGPTGAAPETVCGRTEAEDLVAGAVGAGAGPSTLRDPAVPAASFGAGAVATRAFERPRAGPEAASR